MTRNLKIKTILSILIVCSAQYMFGQNYQSEIAYRITEKDLIPEGITYAASTNSFYVSSIHKKKIIQINAKTGEFKDFVNPVSLNLSFLGMLIDISGDQLWACGNNKTSSMVVKVDLQSGEIIKKFTLTDTVKNTYNDLAQDKLGNVYFTNTEKQTVYKIDSKTEEITLFLDSPEIVHPNGIAISTDDKYLYIASNENGIKVFDMEQGKIVNRKNCKVSSKGLDGLKYYKNSLIGLNNEVRYRSEVKILEFILDELGAEILASEIIDQNNPSFDIPTTFVIVDGYLYCLANSQLANIDFKTNKIRSYEALDDVLILKYKL